jgi:LmbE family N-acetylglucosaminyl deacetylase
VAGKPVLVVAAHPDDEILGCGGTAARLVQEGRDVCFAILGEGITSRYKDREGADPQDSALLHGHARAAAAQIGVKDIFLFQLPDNRLDTVPLLEVVKLVEDVIEKTKPESVYTHHPGDLNVDHGIVHRAVLTATRPMAGQSVREIYAFEVPSSTDWAFGSLQPAFHPNVFVNVTSTLEIKIAAMSCYGTEAREFPHPRSAEALRAVAKRWGSIAGCEAAEAFQLVRSVRF